MNPYTGDGFMPVLICEHLKERNRTDWDVSNIQLTCDNCVLLKRAIETVTPVEQVQCIRINPVDVTIIIKKAPGVPDGTDATSDEPTVRLFRIADRPCPRPWATIPKARDIPLDALSRLDLARDWLETCINSHEKCRLDWSQESELPKRVIDVGGSTRLPRLCHAVDLAPAKYVALSHCWGGHVPLTTTQGTLAARQGGIELDSLPKTFRDAIMVTRALDLQYIWIDSLCIIQDSRQDWTEQAPQMHRIYDNAVLTIAADGAVNGTVGLSSPERALYRSHLVWGSDEDGSAIYASRQAGGWNPYTTTPARQLAPSNQGPLSKRAWTLQERMLSRRTLHFDVNEMAWSCQTMTACECTTAPQMWPSSQPSTRPWPS